MKCSVLVVDDDDAMCETMIAILKTNCDVVAVDSGERAVELMQRRTFDVVLSDIRMGGMSGLELLQIIRQNWPSTNVIMISVISDVSVAVEAMRLGAFFYTTKDFEWDPLNDLVELAMKGRNGGGGGEDAYSDVQALRDENLSLRRECDELRNSLRMPAKISDRRLQENEKSPSRLAG
jgi:DNA-binding NtrC family response regulator